MATNSIIFLIIDGVTQIIKNQQYSIIF